MKKIQSAWQKEIYSSTQLANIHTANNGIAKTLVVNGHIETVYAQASHLPPLQINDEVLYLETAKGIFIIARALHTDESPVVAFQAQNAGLNLSFGSTNIHISQSGDIKLRAKSIQHKSQEDIELNAGRHIKLNSRG